MGKGAEQKEHRYFCRTKAGWLTLCLLLLCVLLLSLRFGSSGMDCSLFSADCSVRKALKPSP